jgi:hypothetical protein
MTNEPVTKTKPTQAETNAVIFDRLERLDRRQDELALLVNELEWAPTVSEPVPRKSLIERVKPIFVTAWNHWQAILIIGLLTFIAIRPFVGGTVRLPNLLPSPFVTKSGLTQWTQETLRSTIPAQYQADFSSSLKEAIIETILMIDQGKFQDTSMGKATDQARTEISLKFQAKLSETERNKNYTEEQRKKLAKTASAFLNRLSDRLSEYSGADSLETVKKVYGNIAEGL